MGNSQQLSTELIDLEGTTLIRVHGEIDIYTASEFENILSDAIQRGTPALIVDLRDTTYLDSAGLSALLSTYKTLADQHREMYVIADPRSPGVRRVLEITRLDTLFHVRDSVEETLDEIRLPKAA